MIVCHLLHFRLDSSKEIKIDDNYLIRKLSFKEVEVFKKKYYSVDKYFTFGLESFPFCIEFKNKINKTVIKPLTSFKELMPAWQKTHDYLDVLNQKIFKFIVSLWIFSGKAVTMGGLLCYDRENILNNVFSLYPEIAKGKFWNVKKTQLGKFIEFWEVFKNKWFDSHDIGIRFFKEAMYSKFDDDRLLKLTIALERILLPDGGGELKNRFSTRAALILAKDLQSRRDIKEYFKNIYVKRSNIVHGEKVKIDKEDYKKYFNYSRKIICLFIENKSGWDNMIKDVSLGENRLKYDLLEYLYND